MRASEPSDQFVACPWFGGEGSAITALPCHQQGPALHEHGNPRSHEALRTGIDGAGVKHRVTLAQKNICALTVASARPLRAWGQPIPSIICAPNVNVGTVWFYAHALLDGMPDDEAKQRGMVAAIMGAQARLGIRKEHHEEFQAQKEAAEKKK
jgi:hypothetical protein